MSTLTPSPLVLSFSPVAPWVGPKPIRLRIMDALVARMKRVTRANGYLTNVGERVDYGQLITAEPPQVPMTNIWDGDETGDVRYGNTQASVEVTVELYDKVSDHSVPLPTIANWMLADCKRGMLVNADGQPDPKIEGLASSLKYNRSSLALGLAGELWVAVIAVWDLVYDHEYGNANKLGER